MAGYSTRVADQGASKAASFFSVESTVAKLCPTPAPSRAPVRLIISIFSTERDDTRAQLVLGATGGGIRRANDGATGDGASSDLGGPYNGVGAIPATRTRSSHQSWSHAQRYLLRQLRFGSHLTEAGPPAYAP